MEQENRAKRLQGESIPHAENAQRRMTGKSKYRSQDELKV